VDLSGQAQDRQDRCKQDFCAPAPHSAAIPHPNYLCALTHISTVSNSAASAMHLKNLDRSKVFDWEAVLS